jgi:hypothetical protein
MPVSRCALLLLLLVFSLSTSNVFAQAKQKTVHRKPPAATEQEVYAAYWTLEPGWHTDIEVRNNITDIPLIVTPTLRLSTGDEIDLAPVTIAPQDVSVISLHEALAKVAPQLVGSVGSYGSVMLRYRSSYRKNVYAGSMIHYEGKPIAFHFDAQGSEDLINEGTRESLWWLPNSTTDEYLIVSNSGAKPSRLTVTILDAAGKRYSQPLFLRAKQTKRFSLRDLVTANGIKDSLGGVTVSVDRGSESVFAANIVFDTSTGFSALMKTFEDSPTDAIGTVELRAPMLALANPDPALALPEGTELEPRIFLRNTTNAPLAIRGELRWRTSSATGVYPLPALSLAPNETRTIDLYSTQRESKFPKDASWANVRLVYTGRYGDLVSIAASYDRELEHGLQTPFTDIVANHWMGGEWHADSLRHSLITAGNASDKEHTVVFTLHYDGGKSKYEIEQKIAPGDQMFVDVAKIIQSQIPDVSGKTIPTDVTGGSYSFRDKDNILGQDLFEGKLTIDRKFGFASYGCAGCCAPTDPILFPDPFNGPTGGNWPNNVEGFNYCDNQGYDMTGSAYSWSTGSVSVMTVTAPVSYGVSPGGTYLSTFINVPATGTTKCKFVPQNPQSSGNVKPTVAISGPSAVPLAVAGTPNAVNTIQLQANPTPVGGTYSWTASAGVTLTNSTSQTATVTSTAAGSSTITVTYSLNGRTASATTSVSVQKPSALRTVSDAGATQTFDCTPLGLPYNGVQRLILYRVLDQSGIVAIQFPNIPVVESFVPVSNTCNIQNTPAPGNGFTLSDGNFSGPDQLAMCSPQCLPADANHNPLGSCTISYRQTWKANGYEVFNKLITDTCTSVTVGP